VCREGDDVNVTDYFGPRLHHPEVTDGIRQAAAELVERVNFLLDDAQGMGIYRAPIDPDTGTTVSGSKGGSGDGGFRPSESRTGSPTSQHRHAHAVDIFDPENALDNWLTDDTLRAYGLYREHPDSTPGWAHLQDVAPRSGHFTFIP
jgi:hypothetical protein